MNKIKVFIIKIKKPLICLIVFLLFSLILVLNLYNHVFAGSLDENDNKEISVYEQSDIHLYHDDSLLIHMIDLKTPKHGDSIIIKYGNTEILIDAGGNKNSGDEIFNALEYYCNDGQLEFAIITHGDQDHIINFYNKDNGFAKWILKNENSCVTLIDFDVLNDKTVSTGTYKCLNYLYKKSDNQSSELINDETYNEYKEFRNEMLLKNKIKNYFCASQITYYLTDRLYKNPETGEEEKLSSIILQKENNKVSGENINFDVAKNISDNEVKILNNVKNNDGFLLSKNPDSPDNSSTVKLKILYNYFYDHSYKQDEDNYIAESVDNNLLSVCSMISIGKTPSKNQIDNRQKFLFTGDLEEYDSSKSYRRVYGETKLIENNLKEFQTPFVFYKAAHHGSDTSNSVFLLDVIRPQYVGISCTAFGVYNFPGQNTISNVTKYTDFVYITGFNDSDNVIPFYGNISFNFNINNNEMIIKYDTDEPSSIFSSEKLLKNRSYQTNIFNLTDISGGETSPNNNYDMECCYIKLGHIDILVNCGVTSTYFDKENNTIKNINALCNDGILDYLIITSNKQEYFNCLKSRKASNYGLIDDPNSNINKITNVFISKYYYDSNNSGESQFEKLKNHLYRTDKVENLKEVFNKETIDIYNTSNYSSNDNLNVTNCELTFLNHSFLSQEGTNHDQNGIPFVISLTTNIEGRKNIIFNYMNLGSIYEANELELIANDNKEFYGDITLLQLPADGYFAESNTVNNGLCNLISKFKNPNNFECFLNSSYRKVNVNGEEKVLNFKGSISTYVTNIINDNKVIAYAGNLCCRIYAGTLSNKNSVRTSVLSSNFSLFDLKNFDINSKNKSSVYYLFEIDENGNYIATNEIDKMSFGQIAGYYINDHMKIEIVNGTLKNKDLR